MQNFSQIARDLGLETTQINKTIQLLDEGATVPFIARYRKEKTGSLDEVQISAIRDKIAQLRELNKRKLSVLKSIEKQGKLTNELQEKIQSCLTLPELEDVYLPFKPKRQTRATKAREKGLEALAEAIVQYKVKDLKALAEEYIDSEKGVESAEEALAGARDIIAEYIAEDKEVRTEARQYFLENSLLVSKVIPGKEEEAVKYKDYYNWSEPLRKALSHRVLAVRRGEKEEFLYLDVTVEEDELISKIEDRFIQGKSEVSEQIQQAIADGYKRLLKPGMETEMRVLSREKADEEAIKVFAENVRELLLAAPLGQKRVLAIDPGYRTGCKVVVLDSQGQLKKNATIFPHTGAQKKVEAEKTIRHLIKTFSVEAIAIGNGTAGRETESFIKSLPLKDVLVITVNESGASIYSASDVAREEFPDQDVTVRGAVSIGRRLMDPLAELVKIDPKSIGVGQYQHDVDQIKLQTSLDDTVISCVNSVGVELNTASQQILAYISGLGPALAKNIVAYRDQNGAFTSRKELMQVPRLGTKAFEQAAGFLRIRKAENPLDMSAVHPERYDLVERMARDLKCQVKELMTNADLRKKLKLEKYISEEVGLPTLQDILSELSKPGRDPRDKFEEFSFTDGINNISDVKVGMKLPGIVTNVTNFGAFVDIGVQQDGLVHISQLSNGFISDPVQVVKVQQKVTVTVIEVDEKRNRISLSMKAEGVKKKSRKKKNLNNDFSEKLNALKSKFG